MSVLNELFTDIADAIREKEGSTDPIPASEFAGRIEAIETSVTPEIEVSTTGLITATSGSNSATKQLATQGAKTVTPTKGTQTAVASQTYTTGAVSVAPIPNAYQDVSAVTAKASDVLTGTTFVASDGTVVNGSMIKRNPEKPLLMVDNGVITAWSHYLKGYYGADSYSSATGSDANLKAENIKSGVSIFGVIGTLEGGAATSNYTVTQINLNNATSLTFSLPAKRTYCKVFGQLSSYEDKWTNGQYSYYDWYGTGNKFGCLTEYEGGYSQFRGNQGSITRGDNNLTVTLGTMTESSFVNVYSDSNGKRTNFVDLWVVDYD